MTDSHNLSSSLPPTEAETALSNRIHRPNTALVTRLLMGGTFQRSVDVMNAEMDRTDPDYQNNALERFVVERIGEVATTAALTTIKSPRVMKLARTVRALDSANGATVASREFKLSNEELSMPIRKALPHKLIRNVRETGYHEMLIMLLGIENKVIKSGGDGEEVAEVALNSPRLIYKQAIGGEARQRDILYRTLLHTEPDDSGYGSPSLDDILNRVVSIPADELKIVGPKGERSCDYVNELPRPSPRAGRCPAMDKLVLSDESEPDPVKVLEMDVNWKILIAQLLYVRGYPLPAKFGRSDRFSQTCKMLGLVSHGEEQLRPFVRTLLY